jgi:hypothetical protein
VISPLRHAGDDATSCASDGVPESVLAIARQGTTADRQGAIIDHQGATADCQHTDAGHQDATVERQGAVTSHQGATIDRQGATADHQGAVVGRQDAVDLAASRPKKALATRCVDGGGHRSQRMDLHVDPTVGANYHGL